MAIFSPLSFKYQKKHNNLRACYAITYTSILVILSIFCVAKSLNSAAIEGFYALKILKIPAASL